MITAYPGVDLGIDFNEADWTECMKEPGTDEERAGSSERPPKYWLSIETSGMDNSMYACITPKWGKP
jgi:hypothetical protein